MTQLIVMERLNFPVGFTFYHWGLSSVGHVFLKVVSYSSRGDINKPGITPMIADGKPQRRPHRGSTTPITSSNNNTNNTKAYH